MSALPHYFTRLSIWGAAWTLLLAGNLAAQPAPDTNAAPAAAASLNAAPAETAAATASSSPEGETGSRPAGAAPIDSNLQQAFFLLRQGKLDEALAAVNLSLQTDPRNRDAYLIRGNVYAHKKLWPEAEKDYATALQIDPASSPARFNLAEAQFAEKRYDDARANYLLLERDPDHGDLSAYRVFICDLFGNHEDAAQKELNAFDQVGANASYYFANAAWSLFHQKPDDAKSWLASAVHIYTRQKTAEYISSLSNLGYPPKPPEPDATSPSASK